MTSAYVPAALRRLVRERANGWCEYRLLPGVVSFHLHQVDHIVAQKHGGEAVEANLALSCILCNQHKGTDLASIDPETRAAVELYHPRRHVWDEHFILSGGLIMPQTPQGRATARLLQFNAPDRGMERSVLASAGMIASTVPDA